MPSLRPSGNRRWNARPKHHLPVLDRAVGPEVDEVGDPPVNATLTIQVRVLGQQAMAQIGALQKQVSALNTSGAAAAATQTAAAASNAGLFARSWQSASAKVKTAWTGIRAEWAKGTDQFKRTITTLGNVGQSLRRSGQQIMFGFTLPVAIAGGAMLNMAMDNERALTQLKKVYGDFSYDTARVNREVGILSKTFELLSNKYGVNQAEVIGIGAEWAATGLAGRDLQRATEATMQAMMLGDLEAERAVKSLISIMATWRTSTDSVESTVGVFSELTDALAILNSTENSTGARFGDLVDGFDRASGAAVEAGMTIEDLSAMIATLVPATGTGAAAGNGIKSMIAALTKMTGDAKEVLGQIGIDVASPEWMGATVTQRIERMAEAFNGLDQAQKNQVSATVAGRWQLTRFSVLMKDIASGTGMYAAARRAATDADRRQGDYLEELNAIMESNPKKMDILTNVLKNELTKAVIQFIPFILMMMNTFGKLAKAFNNLSPGWKGFIAGVIIAIAILGPFLMLLGVLVTTLKMVFEVMRFGWGIIKVLGAGFGYLGKGAVWVGHGLKVLAYRAYFLALEFGKVGIAAAKSAAITAASWLKNAAKAVARAAKTIVLSLFKIIVAMARVAYAAVVYAAKVGWSWLVTAAKQVAESVRFIVFYMGQMILAFLRVAGAAVLHAATVAWSWIVSAATGVASAAGAILVSASGMIGSFVAVMTAAVISASATALAWLGTAGPAVVAAAAAIISALTAITLPMWAIVAVVAAVVAAIVLILMLVFNDGFREGFGNVIQWVIDAFWALPRAIASAMSAVARIIGEAVTAAAEMLSYLNPFQRHSPSLVDNVKAGVATILDEYSKLKHIGPLIMSAVNAHEAFNEAIAATMGGYEDQETAEQRALITKQAPSALPAFDNMVSTRSALEDSLIPLAQEIERQTRIVADLQAEYDKWDDQVQQATYTLDDLERQLALVNRTMDDAQEMMDYYTSVGIEGMRAMEDAIFANTLAQNELKLAIMDLEDANGTIDDLKSRMAELNGEMETLTGERQGLWLAGAGSDILSVYDDQIEAIRQQQEGIEDTVSELDEMNTQLAELERQAERMELERWITFEPQLRQIDQMAKGLEELPYEEIIAGVTEQRAIMDAMKPIQDDLNDKVETQRELVEDLTYQRDVIKRQLDIEKQTLDELESAYSDIKALIEEMTSSMSDFVGQVEEAQSKLDALAEGDYPIDIGTATFDTESFEKEMEEFNKQLEKDLEEMLDGMPDPFGWIMEKWNLFKIGFGLGMEQIKGKWKRFTETLKMVWSLVPTFLKQKWEDFKEDIGIILEELVGKFSGPFKDIYDAIQWANPWAEHSPSLVSQVISGVNSILSNYSRLSAIGGLLEPTFKFIGGLFDTGKTKLQGLGTQFGTFWMMHVQPNMSRVGEKVSFVWNFMIMPAFSNMVSWLSARVGPTFSRVSTTIRTVWSTVGTTLRSVWDRNIYPVLSGMWNFISLRLTSAWQSLQSTVSKVWEGIKSIVSSGAQSMADSVIKGVNAALGAFRWLSGGIQNLAGKIGITIEVPSIPDMPRIKLAKGGIPPTDPDGGLYAGARAIVGEGSKVWPEYVIPTDPKYRDRARMLAQAAAERIGLFAAGGVVGRGGEDGGIWEQMTRGVSNLVNMGSDLFGGGIELAWQPIKKIFTQMVDTISPKIISEMAKYPIKLVEQWMKGVGGDRSILEGWKGRSGSFVALLDYFKSTGVAGQAISMIRPGATTRGSGNTRASLHSMARAVDFGTRPPSVDSKELLAIYRAFLPVKDILTELIYSGPGGSNPRNPITAADHHNHVHVGLARGGMAQAQRVYEFANGGSFKIPHGGDGILARIGEGRNDERVQITPIKDDSGGRGDTIVNINGDLSFPNITDGDEAEKLIENLKALAS